MIKITHNIASHAEKNLAFFFDAGEGYLFVKWLGTPTQGQVMLVRSVVDGQLYVRKVTWPELVRGNAPNREVDLYRPHKQIPDLVAWKQYLTEQKGFQCRLTTMIWSFCNGGDFAGFCTRYRGARPAALIFHLLERSLKILYYLHYECEAPVPRQDFAGRNIFLHWDEDDELPQVLLRDFRFSGAINVAEAGMAAILTLKSAQADYLRLFLLMNSLTSEQEAQGASIPKELWKSMKILYDSCQCSAGQDEEPRKQFVKMGNSINTLILAIKRASEDCVAAYRAQTHAPQERLLKVTNQPDLSSSEDILMMLHPHPIGPFKIVKVDPSTFNVLDIRREVDTDEGFEEAFRASMMPKELSLRRSALRILSSSPSSFGYKPRSITSLSSATLSRTKPSTQLSFYQRRWATTGTEQKSDEEAPISELQPTPAEEVENAIKTEEIEATGTEAAVSSVETPAPAAEASPADQSAIAPAFASGQFAARPPQNDPREERMSTPKETVYVGNLFFDVTEDDLKREMSRFGNVVKSRLMRDARGLSKGFGYVDFDNVDSATAAIESMHQQLYEGRRVVVQYAAFTTADMEKKRAASQSAADGRNGSKNPPTKTLFIGNMSFEMTDRDLNNLFRGIRNVVDVRVAIDRRTGQPRGFAHADFTDVQSAMEAMKVLADKETYGRRLRLDYSHGSSMAPRNQGVPPQRS